METSEKLLQKKKKNSGNISVSKKKKERERKRNTWNKNIVALFFILQSLNGRFYAGRVITAETYDGVTKYDVQETEEEMEKRLQEWEKFIGGDDDEEEESSAESNQT